MILRKIYGSGGEWLINANKEWETLKYFAVNKIPMAEGEVPCYCFTKQNPDGMEPIVFPCESFPATAGMFLVPNKEYVIFIVTKEMVNFWETKYKNIPEEEWPEGLKPMLKEQFMLFQVDRLVEKV